MTTTEFWRCRRVLFHHIVFLLAALGIVNATAQLSPDVVWSETTHNYFVSPVAISPDGVLAASPGTNNSIRLANLADGTAVRHLIGHTNGVASLAFSPNSSLLASTADDRTLRLWNVATGSLLRTISLGAGNRQFTAVAFHPDGQHVASDRHRTNAALYRVSDGTPVWETSGNLWEIQSIAFSPDGSLVAAAGGNRGVDVKIRVIRASDGQLLHSLVTSNSYGVRQLAFSPDGQWLAAGCYESTGFIGGVEIWQVADWSRLRSLPGRAPALAFSPDGKLLVTLRQKAMEFWRIPEGRLLYSVSTPTNGDYSRHLSISISPKGDRIVTGNYRNIATLNGTLTESTTVAFRFPILMTLTRQGGRGTFTWMGDASGYQLQRRWLDSPNWENISGGTTNRNANLSLDGPGAIFRVVGTTP